MTDPVLCPNCNHGTTVEIGLNIGDHRVSLKSCSVCEARWWKADGDHVEVADVLSMASAIRK